MHRLRSDTLHRVQRLNRRAQHIGNRSEAGPLQLAQPDSTPRDVLEHANRLLTQPGSYFLLLEHLNLSPCTFPKQLRRGQESSRSLCQMTNGIEGGLASEPTFRRASRIRSSGTEETPTIGQRTQGCQCAVAAEFVVEALVGKAA